MRWNAVRSRSSTAPRTSVTCSGIATGAARTVGYHMVRERQRRVSRRLPYSRVEDSKGLT